MHRLSSSCLLSLSLAFHAPPLGLTPFAPLSRFFFSLRPLLFPCVADSGHSHGMPASTRRGEEAGWTRARGRGVQVLRWPGDQKVRGEDDMPAVPGHGVHEVGPRRHRAGRPAVGDSRGRCLCRPRHRIVRPRNSRLEVVAAVSLPCSARHTFCAAFASNARDCLDMCVYHDLSMGGGWRTLRRAAPKHMQTRSRSIGASHRHFVQVDARAEGMGSGGRAVPLESRRGAVPHHGDRCVFVASGVARPRRRGVLRGGAMERTPVGQPRSAIHLSESTGWCASICEWRCLPSVAIIGSRASARAHYLGVNRARYVQLEDHGHGAAGLVLLWWHCCLQGEPPPDYSFKPPKVWFSTEINRCSVNTHGMTCLDILQDQRSLALTISKVLPSISSLLAGPIANDPLVLEIAQIYLADSAKHD